MITDQLSEMMIRSGRVGTSELEKALQIQEDTGRVLTDILIEEKLASSEDIALTFSELLNIPYLELGEDFHLDREEYDLIPESVARAIDEPTTLTIPSTVAPRSLASSTAANVSRVSPDWLIVITTVPSSMIGLRYRNSLAYSVSVGIRARCSNKNSPTKAAWNAVPQAVIMSRFVRVSSRR